MESVKSGLKAIRPSLRSGLVLGTLASAPNSRRWFSAAASGGAANAHAPHIDGTKPLLKSNGLDARPPLGQKDYILRHRRPSPPAAMSLIHFRHRFFVRQYVYPVFCLLLLVVLLKWTSDRESAHQYGREYHQYQAGQDQPQQAVLEPETPVLHQVQPSAANVDAFVMRIVAVLELVLALGGVSAIWKPAPVAKPVVGNVVAIEVYMEAQCPDTSNFIHRQLVPTWDKLGHTQRLNVTLVPFGKAECRAVGDDFECSCQHGPTECDLNAMMNCAMERLVHQREYIPVVGCIQGSEDLTSAAQRCLHGSSDKEWIASCARGRRGRYLLAAAGRRTAQLGEAFDFVPWVVLDRTRDIDSFYALEENVCKRLAPTPAECFGAPQPAPHVEQPFRV